MYDPNVEFFTGKHIPLVFVGITFGILTLAYTLVLLLIQPLQKYSHLCCLSWVAKLKPFIDAYTAPHIIKDHCRYWEGLLLLFRLIIAVAVAVNTKSSMIFNLSVIVFMCILLLTITWCVGGVYKKTYLNVLNASCIFNLAILALTFYNTSGIRREVIIIICILDNGAALVTFCSVVICHIYASVRGLYYRCKRHKYQTL